MIHSNGDTLRLDDGPGVVFSHGASSNCTLEAIEQRHIEQALRRCRWRINGPGNAADVLGLHPNTLRFRMKKLGIRRPVDQQTSTHSNAFRRRHPRSLIGRCECSHNIT